LVDIFELVLAQLSLAEIYFAHDGDPVLIMPATALYTKLLKSNFKYFNLLQVGIRKIK
jgi:hypothetical protein